MIDCTDEQLMEEVRRRGFVIRDAQIGRKWVGLTDKDKDAFWRADQMTSEEWGELFAAVEAKLKEKNT